MTSLVPQQDWAGATARNTHYYWLDGQLEAVRQGHWKLVLPHRYRQVATPGQNGEQGATQLAEQSLALYNLQVDPGETMDRATSQSEVTNRLKALADAHEQSLLQNARPPGVAQ